MTNRLRMVVNSTNGVAYASVDAADGRDVDALLMELCAVRAFTAGPLYPLPTTPRTSLERLIASAVKGLLGNAAIELSWVGDEGFVFAVEAEVTVDKLTVRVSLGLSKMSTEVWVNGARRFVRVANPDASMLPIEELVLSLIGNAVDVALVALKAWSMGKCATTRLLGTAVRVCPKTIEAKAVETARPVAVPAVAPALAEA